MGSASGYHGDVYVGVWERKLSFKGNDFSKKKKNVLNIVQMFWLLRLVTRKCIIKLIPCAKKKKKKRKKKKKSYLKNSD